MHPLTAILQTLGSIGVAWRKLRQKENEDRRKAVEDVHLAWTRTFAHLRRLGGSQRGGRTEDNLAIEDDLAEDWTTAAVEIELFSKKLYQLCLKMAKLLTAPEFDKKEIVEVGGDVESSMGGVQTIHSETGYYTFRYHWKDLRVEAISRAGPRFCLFAGSDSVAKMGSTGYRKKRLSIRTSGPYRRPKLHTNSSDEAKKLVYGSGARQLHGCWTKDDIKQLREMFPNMTTAEVGAKLGRPAGAVRSKASRMGLRRSKRYMKSLGRC